MYMYVFHFRSQYTTCTSLASRRNTRRITSGDYGQHCVYWRNVIILYNVQLTLLRHEYTDGMMATSGVKDLPTCLLCRTVLLQWLQHCQLVSLRAPFCSLSATSPVHTGLNVVIM